MRKVYEIEKRERKIGAHLFKNNQYDTVLMNSVLEGYSGRMLVDSDTLPRIARLDTGVFTMFGGNPDLDEVIDFIRYSPICVVTPENEKWREIFLKEFNDKIQVLPFVEYYSNTIDVTRLTEIIAELPVGYEIRRLDSRLCQKLTSEIPNEGFFEAFYNVDDFLKRGIGFCVLNNDKKIVSAATSMAASRNAIDIEIETVRSMRRKGLGTIVGAKLVLYCIHNNIEPKWLAANRDSEKLAARLGFSKGKRYETFQIGVV